MAFAKELIRCKTALRPMGRRALQQALYKAGIEKTLIEQSLQSYSEEQEQEACRALCEKLMKKNGAERTGLAKTQRALAARGFGYETVSRAMQAWKGAEWE